MFADFPGLLLGGFTEGVVKGVAGGVWLFADAAKRCRERWIDTVLFAHLEKISKNTRALWYIRRKHFCNLMQLGNVVISMDSEVSFVDDLGQSQPPNQAMAEKVMSKDNDQHCIGQEQTNGTPPRLVVHYL